MNAPDPFSGQLDAYLDRELPNDARVQLEQHLKNCRACAAELAARSRLRARLQATVRGTTVPGGLEDKVRRELRAQPAGHRTGLYAVAAAAAIIACVSMLWYLRKNHDPEEAILAKTPGRLAALLNIGLRDHLHCAVFRKYSKQPVPAAEMATELGPEYAGLVPLIRAKLPANFEIIRAHHCDAGGRQYTHFIIAGDGKLVSVVLARARPGESLGTGIYQAGVDRFQVVGFESGGELAYVISDMDAQQNLEWAANLAPALRQYLAAHTG